MQRITSIFSISSSLSFLALISILYIQPAFSTSSIHAYTDANCVFPPRDPQVGPPTGACQTITTPNTISLEIQELDLGCTVTIYSDPDCTDHPLEIGVGDCANLNGTTIRSFSIDLCPPGTIDSTRPQYNSTSTASPSAKPTSSNTTFTASSASPSNTTASASGNSNLSAIIGGAVGGGVGLLLITAGLIIYFCRKDRNTMRQIKYPPGPNIMEMGAGSLDEGIFGTGGHNSAHGSNRQFYNDSRFGQGVPGLGQGVGELEGNPGFFRESNKSLTNQRVGAGGSGIFETQAAEEMPLRNFSIPRQELEAPGVMIPRVHPQDSINRVYHQEGLPEIPQLPGPYAT
ncbi:hypothetical protein H072_3944 [Dactylellina haptotyla CBS 200.50]|uniref:Mid2 domain-containing protein n=1 Tax=Dactylellina haptotyla (strain CBS 200.50) TaxID=1284197 RepID=S8AGZ4_DACHA|nr:hypothetical protein H072_3944 [Dactylellina haptotyla CBS 200.50]